MSSSVPASSITQNPVPSNQTGGGPETIDDTDARISYTSSNNHTTWSAESNQRDGIYNHTLHVTKSKTDFATFIFNGTSVSLTSLLSPTGSNFTALLDGVPSGPYSLAVANNRPDLAIPTIVYSVSNLALTKHNLTLSKAKTEGNDTEFNIDSFAVIGWSDPSMSTLPVSRTSGRTVAPPSTTTPGSATTGTDLSDQGPVFTNAKPTGAIIGGVVGGIALLGVVMAGWYFMRRGSRRANKRRH